MTITATASATPRQRQPDEAGIRRRARFHFPSQAEDVIHSGREAVMTEIERTAILDAILDAMAEIEYVHGDMLAEEERDHPRGSGWARVYDKLFAARDLVLTITGERAAV